MGKWHVEVNIKQYLSDDEDRESIQRAYDGIRKELATKLGPHRLVWPEAFDRYAELALEKEDVAIFNLGMNHLYDWADAHRIWLG